MQVLHQLPLPVDKDLLVGLETADDAGVWRLSADTAIITTVDFFPPIVDDPADFGRIAAANAMSDVYAMGGRPKLAMNIVGFPRELPTEVLRSIIEGAIEKLAEAGALLVGGHSVEDRELKFGLSVVGLVHPEKIVRNSGARPGDVLILTKPLGTGVLATALKAGYLKYDEARVVVDSMKELNARASEVIVREGVKAATDITGYGLAGHAAEMAGASKVNIIIETGGIRVFDRALEFIKRKKFRPRSIGDTMAYLEGRLKYFRTVDEALRLILFDPQTSGGILMAVPETRFDAVSEALRGAGIKPFRAGRVVERVEGWLIGVE